MALNQRQSRAILTELAKRQSLIQQLRNECFPAQLAFIDDPSLRKTAQCTRRAGKSYLDGVYFCLTAIRFPGSTSLYIGPTREVARKIMYKDILIKLNKKFQIGMQINKTTLECLYPNGSVLYLIGTDSSPDEAEKALGQKYDLVVIDEAQSYRQDQRYLVHSVLEPACADHRGTICMTGSPGNNLRTYFYDITGRKAHEPNYVYGWTRHKWAWADNPHTAEEMRELTERLKLENPNIEETPFYRQMYLNEWVIDLDALVYKYSDSRNRAESLPSNHEYYYGLSVDLGFEDDTAFVIAAYSDTDKNMYFVEVHKERGMDITDVANKCAYFTHKYKPVRYTIDGAHKQAVAELRNRYGIPFVPSDKHGKAEIIEIMNADFTLGKIKLLPGAEPLVEEYHNLIWDKQSLKRIEHQACPNHASDAGLYGWRMCYHYAAMGLVKPPGPGTDEAMDAWWNKEEVKLARQQKEDDWLKKDLGKDYGFK